MTKLPPLRALLGRFRRTCCEAAGIERYSRPALHDLDRKLERYLGFDGGFFVEAGANDGFQQSNTYYLERLRGWRGLLVEPVPELYERCRRLRRRSVVVQAALVDPDYPGAAVEMHVAGLMSFTADAFADPKTREGHLAAAERQGQIGESGRRSVEVPATTLSALLDRVAPGVEVDFLSLDVEGSELSALAGLDRSRHSPRFICVEARRLESIRSLLADSHDLIEVLVANDRYQDLLFKRR